MANHFRKFHYDQKKSEPRETKKEDTGMEHAIDGSAETANILINERPQNLCQKTKWRIKPFNTEVFELQNIRHRG